MNKPYLTDDVCKNLIEILQSVEIYGYFIVIAFLLDIELDFEIEFLFEKEFLDNEFDYELLSSLPIKKSHVKQKKTKLTWKFEDG